MSVSCEIYHLSKWNRYGNGVEKDLKQTADWYRKSAEQRRNVK